jgi:hypothetical protein
MNISKSQLCVIVFSISLHGIPAQAMKWIYPTPVIKLTQKSPLFEKPSARSESLGIADEETPVLARALSPSETWILVEDSDGNRAWVPTDRSNYKAIRLMDDNFLPPLKEEAPGARVDLELLDKETVKAPPAPIPPRIEEPPKGFSPKRFELGTGWIYGWTGRDSQHKSQWPLSLGFLEAAPSGDRVGLRLTYDPLSLRSFQVNFVSRYSWGRAGLFREFEGGYEKQWHTLKTSSQSALNLGYSVGFYFTPSLSLALRGGLFWGVRSQWNGGVLLRCFVY